jgi:translocation and assembly module TamB
VIDRLTGRSAFGGTLATSGRIGILAPGLPADLQVTFTDLVYTDGTFVSTRLNGALAVSGPLTAPGGLVQGAIDLGTTEILVAEGLGAAGGAAAGGGYPPQPAAPGRPHPRSRGTRRSGSSGGDRRGRPSRSTSWYGRLGSSSAAAGSMSRSAASCAWAGRPTTSRQSASSGCAAGRLTILAQRIEFEQGSVRLVGNLDPQIDFTAQTVTDEATAIVRVSGRASKPDISFSSVPPLPEDEVLALIIFNRTSQQLSPFQIAQLAAAAAELTGAGGNGLLGRLRGAVGLADLDIVAGESGGTAVRAGRYIDDNIYLDVQAGSGADTRVNVNLDVTTDVTVRGSVDAEGNSRVGVFYTRDY